MEDKRPTEFVLMDLFSGIGGFHLGLERAGFKFSKVYYSEIDKHAIAIYKHKFKDAEYIGSVESVGQRPIKRPNIITFGSPCQDFSVAGQRRGLEGERSSLIGQAIRLVALYKPDVFIWENVKGTFSSNDGADFWAIIQAFTNIGGYRFEWQLLNTSWFLPQNRERIYFVGYLTGRCEPGIFPVGETGNGFEGGTQDGQQVAACLQSPEHASGNYRGMNMVVQKTRGDCMTIKDNETGTLQGGGANVMDKIPNIVIHNLQRRTPDRPSKIAGQSGGSGPLSRDDGNTYALDTQNSNAVEIKTKRLDKDGNKRPQGYRVYDPSGDSPAIASQQGGVVGGNQLVQISTRKSFDGNEEDGKRAWRDHQTDGEVPALTSQMGMGGDNVPYINRIRKLTEIECERLQGFPDDFTKFGNYDGEVKKVSKTQRYKTLGNAVTVDVVEAVGKKIKTHLTFK